MFVSVFDISFQFWMLFCGFSIRPSSRILSTLCSPLWSLLVGILIFRFSLLSFLFIPHFSKWLVWLLCIPCSHWSIIVSLFPVSSISHSRRNRFSCILYLNSCPIVVVQLRLPINLTHAILSIDSGLFNVR